LPLVPSHTHPYPLSLHDALPIWPLLEAAGWPLEVVVAVTDSSPKAVDSRRGMNHTMATSPYYPAWVDGVAADVDVARKAVAGRRSEEHTSELQSRFDLVCRLLLE